MITLKMKRGHKIGGEGGNNFAVLNWNLAVLINF